MCRETRDHLPLSILDVFSLRATNIPSLSHCQVQIQFHALPIAPPLCHNSSEGSKGQPQWEATTGPLKSHRKIWPRGPGAAPGHSETLLLEPRCWDAGETAQGSALALSPCGEENRSSVRKLLLLGDSFPSPWAQGRYLGCLLLLGHLPGFPNPYRTTFIFLFSL